MTFRFQWSDGLVDFWETYTLSGVTDQATAEAAAGDMLADFNREELRRYGPHARPRRVLKVEFIGGDAGKIPHDWKKQNAVTVVTAGGGSFDRYRCQVCGAAGVRRGLSATVERVGRWKAGRFEYCQPTEDPCPE